MTSPLAGWHPICTAPRDGDDILLAYHGRFGRHVTIGRFDDGRWRSDSFSLAHKSVYAWMPLPEPPEEQEEWHPVPEGYSKRELS